jgi:hypothetical protein
VAVKLGSLVPAALLASLPITAQAPATLPAPSAPVTATTPSRLLSWKMAYFYDEDLSSLTFHDIQFPGPKCAFALATEVVRGRVKSVAVRSTDGGKTWAITPLKSHGRSAFFLSERLGWLVTEDGIERSNDCGVTWERVGREKGLVRAWFRDEALGWAVGLQKKAMATRDGGKTWTALQPVDNPTSSADRSAYAWVEFANGEFGAIVGWHTPQRKDTQAFPVWMDPEAASSRRQFPSLTLMLQTQDGGSTWRGFTASLMGRMTRLRMRPDGAGLALIEFDETFDYPSEVFLMGKGEKEIRRVYRQKDHAVTDIAITSDGSTYLAGVQTPGAIRLPVPGKVRILRSRDSQWVEDQADYRAVANRIYLAASPSGQLIAATDTGMILRLE